LTSRQSSLHLSHQSLKTLSLILQGQASPALQRKSTMTTPNQTPNRKQAPSKYEVVVMAVHRSKVLHIAGPFKGGTHDLEMFRQGGLKEKPTLPNRTIGDIRQVALFLADRGYNSKIEDQEDLFSLPNEFEGAK
jgi:hypothetical protein